MMMIIRSEIRDCRRSCRFQLVRHGSLQ